MKKLRHILATTFLFLAVKSEPEWVKSLMIHNEPVTPTQAEPELQPIVEGGESIGA